jgi:hypothetical protein
MLTRDLIPTIYMRPLYLKADHMESFQPGLSFIPVSPAEFQPVLKSTVPVESAP